MKGYISGNRDRNGEVTIRVDGRRLDPAASLALRNHSPTGFEWGYSGSGPAQTSLAILLDLGASKEDAQKHYQDFKSEFIATQPRHVLHVPISHVWAWAKERGVNIRPWGRVADARKEETRMAKPDNHQQRTERYHKEFAAQLIEQIKKGTAPWQKPWKPGERIAPRNLASGRSYTGSNTVRLMAVAADKGYSDSRWATYGQIQAAGGQIRKGEKGTRIISFKSHRRVPVKDEKGKPVKDKKGEQVYRHEKLARPFTRIYTVFNVEQARGIKPEPRPEPAKAWQAHKRAEEVIKASGVPVKHVHGDRAYYSLSSDQVVLPEKSQFPSADHYYQTALHEVGHASGHPDRLNRDTLQQGLADGFGSEAYAREELRAEISAMMTGDRLGTGHDPSRGAAYVSSWVEVLDKNPQEIVNASAEAQRMSNYLITRAQERQQPPGDKRQDQARPPHVDDAKQRTDQPPREYRPVPVPHRPGVYRIEDANDPGRPLPKAYATDWPGKAEAERGIERLQRSDELAQQNIYIAAPTVSVEVPSTPGMGGKAARWVEPAEAVAIQELRSAGIRCEPGAQGGWDCTEASRNEHLGNFSSPELASRRLIGSPTQERQPAQGEKTQEAAVPRQHAEQHYRVARNKAGKWRIESDTNPKEKLPSYAQQDFRNVVEANRALKRLRQDQARPAHVEQARQRAAGEHARPNRHGSFPAQQGVIVEEKPAMRAGRPAARIAGPNEALVRGAGRPGVRQDQFPTRAGPER